MVWMVWMVWFMAVMTLRGEGGGGVGGVERRMALVIGCSYPESELTLPSPVKDARAMKRKLGEVGFAGKDVRLLENPTRKEMMEAIDAFGEELGRQGGVGVFYFSGHGAQHEGENYMFPAKAAIGFREDLPGEGIAASRMITRMESAKNRVNLVFLDACRNNPLPSSKKKTGLGKGLAGMEAVSGMLIGFATGPNTVANDGGDGSLYTNALLKELGRPGVSVTDMLTHVNAEVRKTSGGEQIPIMESGLSEVFALVPGKEGGTVVELAKLEVPKVPVVVPEVKVEPVVEFVVGQRVAEMVKVEGGQLPADSRVPEKTVGRFWMGKYEVTWGEFQTVRSYGALHGYDIGAVGAGSGNNYPVTRVSWYQALKWCNARSEMEGLTPVYTVGGAVYRSGNSVPTVNGGNGYRLPIEAEWEYAASGGALTHGYEYSGSADVNAVAWYLENSGGGAHVAGTKLGNELGLYDMSGNVWEWCFDVYTGTNRVFRGGSWGNYAINARVSTRYGYGPSYSDNGIGFRVVRSSVP